MDAPDGFEVKARGREESQRNARSQATTREDDARGSPYPAGRVGRTGVTPPNLAAYYRHHPALPRLRSTWVG